MTESMGAPPDGAREATPPPGRIVRSLLRAAGSTAVLVAIYYLLPLDHSARWVAVTALVIGLASLVGLVAFQVRAISGSRYPGLRALEALALEAYRAGEITEAEVQQMLHMSSRWEAEAFLKRAQAYLDYSEADLEQDIAALRRVLPR